MNTLKILKKYEAKGMHYQLPVVWDKGSNSVIIDNKGRKYIDFSSGICATNIGHANSEVLINIVRQATKLYHSYTFPTEIRAKLVEKVCKMTGFDKVFLTSAGTEATEAACKIMMLYGRKRNKFKIMSFWDSMHGKTALASSLSDFSIWGLQDLIVRFVPLFDFDWSKEDELQLEEEKKHLAGIIIESYQGYSARFYNKKYIQKLVKWAKKNKILVCFDEIQGGFYRTGKLFAYEHYDIPKPDLVCIGKGFGAGLPIAGVLGRKELIDLPDDLSSTNSGNPLCCAGALANLEVLEKLNKKELQEKIELFYNYLILLKKVKIVKELNIKGLLAGIIVKNKKIATKIVYKCLKRGLILILTNRESVKLAPPLTISKEELKKGIEILLSAIKND